MAGHYNLTYTGAIREYITYITIVVRVSELVRLPKHLWSFMESASNHDKYGDHWFKGYDHVRQFMIIWGCSFMGYPNSWMVYKGKSHLQMIDDWGYPHVTKPPYRELCHIHTPMYMYIYIYMVPSGKLTKLWKITIFNGPFSIARHPGAAFLQSDWIQLEAPGRLRVTLQLDLKALLRLLFDAGAPWQRWCFWGRQG